MNTPSANKRKQKERVKCRVCSAPVSSRNCDSAVFGARNPTPTVIFESKETGQSEEEKLKEIENRLREKGWNL